MTRRILTAFLLIAAFVVVDFSYRRWSAKRAMNNGDVFPDTGNADVNDPDIASKDNRAAPLATPASPTAITQPLPPTAPTLPRSTRFPPADTQAPNSPNGIRIPGKGRFQLYRQGDLTFRVDTRTGQTCVLFATYEQWSNPEVYSHGCRSAPTP